MHPIQDKAISAAQRIWAIVQRPASAPWLIILASLGVYLSNQARIDVGDTVPARYLPVSILREGNLDLDEIVPKFCVPSSHYYVPSRKTAYFMHRYQQHHYSVYPVAPSILAVPVFAAARLVGVGWDERGLIRIEKCTASLFVALSVGFLFLTLREFLSIRWALVVAAVYAFGTSSWSVTSQALWQHSASQMMTSLALLLLVRGGRAPRLIAWAGVAVAVAVLCRPTNIIVAAGLGGYVLVRHTRQSVWFIVCGLPFAGLLLAYNWLVCGNFFGGYVGCANWFREAMPLPRVAEHLAGLLVSPSRGLFIYSPILLLAVPGVLITWWRRKLDLFFWSGLVCMGYVSLIARWPMWYGGNSFGPRLLSDALPFFALLLVPVVRVLPRSRLLCVLGAPLLVWSFVVHGTGAFWDDGTWDANPPIHLSQERLWDWGRPQFLHVLRRGRVTTGPQQSREHYLVRDHLIDFRTADAARHFRYGFSGVESWGTWALWKRARLRVSGADLGGQDMVVKAMQFRRSPWLKRGQQMDVYVNGEHLRTHKFRKAHRWETIHVRLPAELSPSDSHTVTFRFAYCRSAGGHGFGDPRPISAGFETIRFEEAAK